MDQLLHTFLNNIDAEIELDKDLVPLPQRQYNEHVIDKILSSKAFSNADINIINNCRLYLQAVTIANLSTACSTRLNPFLLQGRTSLLSSTTCWITINQARPNKAVWRKWCRAMRIWSRNDGTLYRPLGAWWFPGDTLRRTWPFYKDLTYPFLYVNTPNKFLQYANEDNGRCSIMATQLTFNSSTHGCNPSQGLVGYNTPTKTSSYRSPIRRDTPLIQGIFDNATRMGQIPFP
jgi:hypothetical protein